MFQFPAFASDLIRWYVFNISGCPIRKSMDQRLFAPTHGLSQLITSFIACKSQGIHRTPFPTFYTAFYWFTLHNVGHFSWLNIMGSVCFISICNIMKKFFTMSRLFCVSLCCFPICQWSLCSGEFLMIGCRSLCSLCLSLYSHSLVENI